MDGDLHNTVVPRLTRADLAVQELSKSTYTGGWQEPSLQARAGTPRIEAETQCKESAERDSFTKYCAVGLRSFLCRQSGNAEHKPRRVA